MTKCKYCGFESESPKGYTRKFCDSCISEKEIGVFAPPVEHVKLVSMTVTKKQLEELDRRVILPIKREGGGYYVGRRGENGKIQERWPRYHS